MSISPTPEAPMTSLVCYVITYNRPALLEQTLSSIAKSNFKNFRLVVIDNGGDNPADVEDVVGRQSKAHPIELIRFPVNQTGDKSPFFFAATESESDFLMIFHDDDLLHPDYLTDAVSELQKRSECAFVCAYGKSTAEPKYSDFSGIKLSRHKTVAADIKALAKLCMTGNRGIYGATVYRRANLRKVAPYRLVPFGKIHDRPVWCEALNGGSAVFFNDEYVLYRIHAGQDTVASSSGPFPEECIALLKYYRGILGDALGDEFGRTFVLNQRSFLREMWKWPALRSRIAFTNFALKAVAMGAATPLIFVPRFVMRFLRKRQRLFHL